MSNISALVSLVVFAIVLFGIGVWAAKQSASGKEFLLGGRNLGPFVAGIAYAASSSSAWVLLGFTGFVYATGPSALWMLPGILTGYAVVWFWAGPVLQKSSEEKDHLTLTDFLVEDASGKLERVIRFVASLMIAFCFSYYVASQFQGAGVAFNSLFSIDANIGIIIGAVLIVTYTFLGGLVAVSVINTLQGILMAAVAVILPLTVFVATGGFSAFPEMFASAPAEYSHIFGGRTGFIALGFVVGLSAVGYSALGQPQLTAWIMAARDEKARLSGAIIAISWACIVFAGMAILGLSARSLYGGEGMAESVFFRTANDLLPAVFAGVIAAATLSAIMSTVDSIFLVAGGAVSHDMGVAKALNLSEVLVSRVAIIVICIIAVLITLTFEASIFDRVIFAWTSLGASFGPIVIARILNHRPTGIAVLSGIITGFGLSLGYEFVFESGPGQIWARLVPWIGSFSVLAVFAIADNRNKLNGTKV